MVIKKNNSLSNLRKVSHLENIRNENTILKGKNIKPIIQYNIDGTIVHVWKFAREAVKGGFSNTAINNCLHGRSKTHKGYIWKYA